MMIEIDLKIVGEEVLLRLDKLPSKVHAAVEAKFSELVSALRAKVAENLSGKVLQTKSGALLSALTSGVERQGNLMIGFVAVEPENESVKEYALAHEYGGKSEYIIRVGKKGILANLDEDFFSRRDVIHPAAKERSYLRSALADFEPIMLEGMEDAVFDAIYGS